MVIWEEGDNIAIYIKIPCVFYIDMPRKKLTKKKDGDSKDEVALEPASYLSSYERGVAEVVEAEVVDFIDDYTDDEDEGTFESPSGIGRSENRGDFNYA